MPWLIILSLLPSLLGVAALPVSGKAADAPEAGKSTCAESLQALVDQTPAGGKLSVADTCVFREEVILAKPITLEGNGVAEIRGSDVWTDWVAGDRGWVSARPVPDFSSHGACQEGSGDRCLWPEQVFRDGRPLLQIAAGMDPWPGEFALNAEGHIVIADDPGGAVMEVTARQHWIRVQADDVTISGFTMKHAAAAAQRGGVEVQEATNWVVQDSVLSDAHGANIYFNGSTNGRLIGNDIFNGGQLGVGGDASSVLIRGNRIHHNNTEDFYADWEAGGIKITQSGDVTVDQNQVFLNAGHGIWCDIDCVSFTARDNEVDHNLGIGIFFEISDGAEISGNRVWENGWRPHGGGWAYDAGILVSSSRNALVHNNIVAWNGDGIAVISQCRATLADEQTCDMSHRWNDVYGNKVYGNSILLGDHVPFDSQAFALGWLRDIKDEYGEPYTYMFTDEARNKGYDNAYWFPEGDEASVVRFAWGDRMIRSLDEFNDTPGEENGHYLDHAERDRILNDAGIPLVPQDRP